MGNMVISTIMVTKFGQNCVLLWDDISMKGVIVDPGGEVNKILSAINDSGVTPQAIWITHGHIDHIGGAMELKENIGVDIIGPHIDDRMLCESVELQGMMLGATGNARNLTPDRWLQEGDVLDFSGHSFRVLHCPGHSPGHVAFINEQEKFAHVGDVLFNRSIGRADLPGGDHETLIRTIKEKLLTLGDDIRFICGHGAGGIFGEERCENPFLN